MARVVKLALKGNIDSPKDEKCYVEWRKCLTDLAPNKLVSSLGASIERR